MCKYVISEADYEWKCPHEALTDSEFCIFHLESDKKDKKKFSDALDKILKNSEKAIHLDGFYFPPSPLEFKERKFEQVVYFLDAKINGEANFSNAVFTEGANFQGAMFTKAANFSWTAFQKGAEFTEATFNERASFEGATFNERASFEGATFSENANFEGATFAKGANFTWTNFTTWSNFIGASFNEKTNFIWTTFTERANFIWTTFNADVNFNEAVFLKESNFIWTVFAEAAYFEGAKFNDDANFHEATFNERAEFTGATFTEYANFHEAMFNKKANFEKATFKDKARFAALTINGEINFRNVAFEKPEHVAFRDGTSLKGALFEGTDLRKIDFVDVEWGYTGSVQKRVLLKEEGVLNFEKLEKSYREIRQNYETQRNFQSAGAFYVSEMEMRRKRKDPAQRIFSITALRRYLSYYGENYWMPLLYFILLIFGSAVLYLYLGLMDNWLRANLHVTQYFIYSVQAATLQRPGNLEQFTILGDLVLTLETVLGPFFLIICALALWRRFQR